MQNFIRKNVPDWLAIILVSKLLTTLILLQMGYG